ncbi:hypothetical protein Q9314_15200 [Shinella sumterensis]|nr:hypothetical protein Q9314_15200 [Shinella sumterensis]
MQQKQGMPFVGYLVFALFVPFTLSLMASVAAFAFAGVALAARIISFLKSGYWVHSACDATVYLSWNGFNVPDACRRFSFSWMGVNYLLRQGLVETDVSFFALLVGSALLVIGAVGTIAITALAQKLPN